MGSGSNSKPKKKQFQKSSKKKTRSHMDKKMKKLKRRHDSVSCSDEDSVSNSSVSCHSSKDDYKSKKRVRSRDRKDRKDHKKRVKRNRSVSESSRDDSPCVKKRKRSKKSKDSESRKKRHGKKRRRSPSVSSSSGRSMSRSSREHTDDSERESERKEGKERKGRTEVKEKSSSKKREKGKIRSVSKSRGRSKSGSPCSFHSDSHSFGSEDRLVVESNPKRLKSVIVVARDIEEDEIREPNWDGNKAEIDFEHDDYPGRSNDSNEGVSRRDAISFSHDVNSGKPKSLDDSCKETVSSDIQTAEIPESQRQVLKETGEVHLHKFGSEGIDQLKGIGVGVSTETAGSNCDDLAAILRQKALENFLKRQGKSSTNSTADKKGDLHTELNSSSSVMTDQVQDMSDKHSGFKSFQSSGKANEVRYSTDVPSSAKGNTVSLPRRELGIKKYTAPCGFADSRMKLVLSSPRKEFIRARNTWRRQLVSPESSLAQEQNIGKDSTRKLVTDESFHRNPSTPKTPIDKDPKRQFAMQEVSEPNHSVPKDALDPGSSRGSGSACLENTVGTEKVEGDAASQPSAMVEHSSNEKTNEADGDSQFEQKTMSVMKGGELVQVSYKVYIPKKALARRQLKR